MTKKKKTNKGDVAINALTRIHAMEPPACSPESMSMTDDEFRDVCRNMARVARVALHKLGVPKK